MQKISIALDRKSERTLSQQLYEQLRDMILHGRLVSGEQIPTSRELARNLQLSRPTVSASLNQLAKEGYLEIKHGSGTFVRAQLRPSPAILRTNETPANTPISEFGRIVQIQLPGKTEQSGKTNINFYYWRPALDQFPTQDWTRVLGRQMRTAERKLLDDWSNEQGTLLQEAICGLVNRFRGVICRPEQVILVSCLDQALELVCRLHLDSGSSAAVENPGYDFARIAVNTNKASVVPIAVDDEGLRVDELSLLKQAPRIVYVTPSRQFPTGSTMSIRRRLALLEWANRANALIVEDDYDSEYEFEGQPVPALSSLDATDSVLYAGSLQQLMFPSIGIAYLVVPPHLVSLYEAARRAQGIQLPAFLQAAVAEFITDGHLDRHVKRLRSLYSRRRTILIDALRSSFGETVDIRASGAGVFVIVRFETSMSSREICRLAAAIGVGVCSTEQFYTGAVPDNELILGFGNLDEHEIQEGIRMLARIFGIGG